MSWPVMEDAGSERWGGATDANDMGPPRPHEALALSNIRHYQGLRADRWLDSTCVFRRALVSVLRTRLEVSHTDSVDQLGGTRVAKLATPSSPSLSSSVPHVQPPS